MTTTTKPLTYGAAAKVATSVNTPPRVEKERNEMTVKEKHYEIQKVSARRHYGRYGLQPRVYVWADDESIMEQFVNRRFRPTKVYREAVLEEFRSRGIEVNANEVRWSQKAGCACPCSPGFVLSTALVDSKRQGRGRYEGSEFSDFFADELNESGAYGNVLTVHITIAGPKVEDPEVANDWQKAAFGEAKVAS